MNAPEKIFHWRNTQLSIARFYGGLRAFGHEYTIDVTDPDAPLVRADIFAAEQKASEAERKKLENERILAEVDKQIGLI
jgi:hypothetical protein